jgi:hypothetical protein
MAYTILKSNGQVLTTIADGTINTTSTALGLPGRNYAGYGQVLDTNFVHIMENFANTSPPPNPLQGQLWYNTNANTLYVCPADGTANANAWLALAQSGSSGTTTFGTLVVTGNITANNATITNALSADTITVRLATVTDTATVTTANVTTLNAGTSNTRVITTGANSTGGTITGTWTLNGGGTANSIAGTSLLVQNGNIQVGYANGTLGIKTDNYYYANGNPISFAGTYNNGNVFDYLTGGNSVSRFGGAISVASVTTANITTGSNSTAGQITGNFTLTSGSRLNATYADLAERFEADAEYEYGTVVELGGDKEVTAVKLDLSENVFGVVSNTAAYLMNGAAGDDKTHPPIALAGRVEVKAIGKVNKFDRLVSAGNGVARSAKSNEITAFNTIGRALANKSDDGVGMVLAIVTIK